MRRIKKLLTLGLAVLLMLCMGLSLVGCKQIDHNAVIISDGITYQEEWLENNYVYGVYKWSEDVFDETSPQSRTCIIRNQTELDEVFLDFPEIDFEKEMVIVYCYRTSYIRAKQVLKMVTLDGNILNVEFKVVKGKMGHADKLNPERRMLVIKLDRLDIAEVKVTYNGQ